MIKIFHLKFVVTYFGGTFDPIHYGHLLPLQFIAKKIGLKKIILMPNYVSPKKSSPKANIKQRINMIKLAIENNPLFSIDTREIECSKPSYTVNTLISIRKEIGWKKPLLFILGKDAFLSIHTWFCWKKILNLCHLVIYNRKGCTNNYLNQFMKKHFKKHKIKKLKKLNHKPFGFIYKINTPLINISSTEIRKNKKTISKYKFIIPKKVLNYIKKKKIY